MSTGRRGAFVCALSFAVLSINPLHAQSGKPELRRLDIVVRLANANDVDIEVLAPLLAFNLSYVIVR